MRLLDTDVCIEILRGNADVIARRAAVEDDVGTTWSTAAELHFGAARSRSPERNAVLVDGFLATLDVLLPCAASARIFGEAKALLRCEGRAPADADLWIASVAAARGAVVVSGNVAHFRPFPGLVVEDWIRG